MPADSTSSFPDETREGLCASCRWARRIRPRGHTAFVLCELSRRDERFPRYPRLPRHTCLGFEGSSPAPS